MNRIVEGLRSSGVMVLPEPISEDRASRLAAHLRVAPCYEGHVRVYGDGVPRSYEDASSQFDLWCHDLATVVAAPYLWEFVVGCAPVAVEYLGGAARLYSMNAFWTRPTTSAPRPDLQGFHRDRDDERFVALFVYGTPVPDLAGGPHVFVVGSHLDDDPAAEAGSRSDVSVLGPAGTAFFVDTSGLHMGAKPLREPRLLIWARWGVSERPWAYVNDQLSPVSQSVLGKERYAAMTDEEREMVRLLVA